MSRYELWGAFILLLFSSALKVCSVIAIIKMTVHHNELAHEFLVTEYAPPKKNL